jgi:hypothetical protein
MRFAGLIALPRLCQQFAASATRAVVTIRMIHARYPQDTGWDKVLWIVLGGDPKLMGIDWRASVEHITALAKVHRVMHRMPR